MLQKMASTLRLCSRRFSSIYRARVLVLQPGSSTSTAKSRTLSMQCGLVPSRPSVTLPTLLNGYRWFGSGGSGLTAEVLQERILEVLKLFDKVNPDKVTPDAHFIKDMGLDSLDVVEIVMAFEDEFAVEISDEEAEGIFTCNDAFELLKVKMDIH